MRRMGGWVAALMVALGLWAGTAGAAITWTVLRPQDCTALAVPAPCCIGNQPASNTAACNKRMNFGDLFEALVTFREVRAAACTGVGQPAPCCTGAGAGATCGTGTYTPGGTESAGGGDSVLTAATSLNTIVWAACEPLYVTGTTGTQGNSIALVRQKIVANTACTAAGQPSACCTGSGTGNCGNGNTAPGSQVAVKIFTFPAAGVGAPGAESTAALTVAANQTIQCLVLGY